MAGFFDSSGWSGGPRTVTLPQCGRCGLYKGCTSPKMKPSGAGKVPILFVGEAPGETEDEEGKQFVGKAGTLLRDTLEDLGLDIDDCLKTNAIICRPPENKTENTHIECCRPNLQKTVSLLKPKVIVLLGASAVSSLLKPEWGEGTGPITRWAGWTIPSAHYKAWVCPTFHPSYLLRSKEDPVLEKYFRQHLKKAIRLVDKAHPLGAQTVSEAVVDCFTDPKASRERIGSLIGSAGVLAFDYECDSLKPENPANEIFSVSFCFEGKDTFACRIDESCYPVLSEVLKDPRLLKVASNLKMEERWTRRKLGHPVRGWHWDTALAAHILDNREGITSVKFQMYVRLGLGNYSAHMEPYLRGKTSNGRNRIREAPILDVLKYNGMDSLGEFIVCKDQQREMGYKI